VTRENGSHALRHFDASTALHEGESIKALSEYLGHADPGFTLRTYTHLAEDSAERMKRAVNVVFGTERRNRIRAMHKTGRPRTRG
jgi:integrase